MHNILPVCTTEDFVLAGEISSKHPLQRILYWNENKGSTRKISEDSNVPFHRWHADTSQFSRGCIKA